VSKRVSLEVALANVRANKYGRMVGRERENRLEPECWPHVQASFQFTKDQKFFAIGSCFATNISRRLSLDGYNVHGDVVSEGNQRNRYTPPAIYQELAWAKAILDRDDTPTEDDIRPLLIEATPGRWSDLWCPPNKRAASTYEQAVEDRMQLYRYFSGAFLADVVIITLGLIEAWWDEVSQSYVMFDSPWARRADGDRFAFEKLSFAQCKDYVERSLKLVLDGHRRVLMTTSPVIMARTFTDQDVIVANTHSKSVLRAVAGELTDAHDQVDYFPSYEIATLTRRPEVWEDDLTHVQSNFVARIMQHVTNSYVPGSVGVDERELMRMANLADSQQLDRAEEIYQRAGDAAWTSVNPAVHVAGMALARARGASEVAVRHGLMLDVSDRLLYANQPHWMLAAANLLRQTSEHRPRADDLIAGVRRACRERTTLYLEAFVNLERMGHEEALRDLIHLVIEDDVNDALLAQKVCSKLYKWGELKRALDVAERQLARTPDEHGVLVQQARILIRLNKMEAALGPLQKLAEADFESQWAHLNLARTLKRLGRNTQALDVIERFLEAVPGNPQALAMKASLLRQHGRHDEAAEAARSAFEAAPDDAFVVRTAQLILGETVA
jgi:tetratricopeptide (TPR) repeat protein